jgi:hypothetical protein
MAKRTRCEKSDGFHEKKGRYVAISSDKLTATRAGDTYDHGVCFSQKPLKLGDVFQLRINEMDSKWAGSLVSGDLSFELHSESNFHNKFREIVASAWALFIVVMNEKLGYIPMLIQL